MRLMRRRPRLAILGGLGLVAAGATVWLTRAPECPSLGLETIKTRGVVTGYMEKSSTGWVEHRFGEVTAPSFNALLSELRGYGWVPFEETKDDWLPTAQFTCPQCGPSHSILARSVEVWERDESGKPFPRRLRTVGETRYLNWAEIPAAWMRDRDTRSARRARSVPSFDEKLRAIEEIDAAQQERRRLGLDKPTLP